MKRAAAKDTDAFAPKLALRLYSPAGEEVAVLDQRTGLALPPELKGRLFP